MALTIAQKKAALAAAQQIAQESTDLLNAENAEGSGIQSVDAVAGAAAIVLDENPVNAVEGTGADLPQDGVNETLPNDGVNETLPTGLNNDALTSTVATFSAVEVTATYTDYDGSTLEGTNAVRQAATMGLKVDHILISATGARIYRIYNK